MQIYQDTFIGIVDILGYAQSERMLGRYPPESLAAIMSQVFQSLDSKISLYNHIDRISWVRYGDGYVCYSHDNSIQHLKQVVYNCCNLLALSLSQGIPLRIALTQNTLHVDYPNSGISITGPGWDTLRDLEKRLDWMGGLLYLPTFHRNTSSIQDMLKTAHLIKKQVNAPNNLQHFHPPFKDGKGLNTDHTWFLNWFKVLRRSKDLLDRDIKNWWIQFVHDRTVNESEDVKRKQENTIRFADYCRILYEAAGLVFFSDLCNENEIQYSQIQHYL